MRSNAGMANRQRDVDLRFAQVSAPISTLAWLGLKPSNSSHLPAYEDGSVPKRRHIKFRRQVITQKKAYNKLIPSFSRQGS